MPVEESFLHFSPYSPSASFGWRAVQFRWTAFKVGKGVKSPPVSGTVVTEEGGVVDFPFFTSVALTHTAHSLWSCRPGSTPVTVATCCKTVAAEWIAGLDFSWTEGYQQHFGAFIWPFGSKVERAYAQGSVRTSSPQNLASTILTPFDLDSLNTENLTLFTHCDLYSIRTLGYVYKQ